MAVKTIRLPDGEWKYDDADPLGKAGGFGEVFRGRGKDRDVAVKRLKLSAKQAAHRELKIGHQLMQRELSNVVPILDAGQDANSDRYFLVMPVCDCSLQDKIDESEDGVDINTANDAITAIIAGLQEVGDITHRDLKPANILLHDGKWKVADFGIAKFVEDSTSLETLRDSLTPAYAAPEQWQGERPSSATDVYALGCIIHALINGQPPFDGSVDDIREKHLHSAPAQISKLSSRFSVFVSQMLRKPSDARPTLVRCSQVLPGIRLGKDAESGSHSALAEAAKQVAGWEAQEEAERQAADTLRRKRDALFEDAKREMFAIRDRLFNSIKEQSESVKITPKGFLAFGHAGLELKCEPEKIEKFIMEMHGGRGNAYNYTGWDVLGWSIISVACLRYPADQTYTWSATLLYADRKDGNGFRWYEVAFWTLADSTKDEPFALEGYKADIDLALGNIMHTVNVAYGPLPIDGEDEERFIERWMGLVAKAATGDLSKPNSMPISDFG